MSRDVLFLNGARSYTLAEVSADSKPGSVAGRAAETFTWLSGLCIAASEPQVSDGEFRVSVGEFKVSVCELKVSACELSTSSDKRERSSDNFSVSVVCLESPSGSTFHRLGVSVTPGSETVASPPPQAPSSLQAPPELLPSRFPYWLG